MLLWGSCVLSFSYVLGLVDPPTRSCRSTKGSAWRAVQAVFPMYPSLSRLTCFTSAPERFSGATAIPRLCLLSRLGALTLDQASFAKDYLGGTPLGKGSSFSSPGCWWRPSTCLPCFPCFCFSFFLHFVASGGGDLSL